MTEPTGGGGLRAFLRSYWTPAGRQALRNLIGLVVCTGISQACALGVLLILTHGLSQSAFGAVIFALNVQTYLFTIGTFGLTTVVVRDLTQQPEKTDETITAYLTIVTVASVLVGVVTAVVAAVVPVSWDERVMLWCMAAGNVAACLNLNPIYDAAHKQALAAGITLPGDCLLIGIILAFYLAGSLTVTSVGIAMMGKWSLTIALQAAVLHRVIRPLRLCHNGRWIRRLLSAGRPMVLAVFLWLVPLRGGVVLTRLAQGTAETAVYGFALQLASPALFAGLILVQIIRPHILGPMGVHSRFLTKLVVIASTALLGIWTATVAVSQVIIRLMNLPEYGAGAMAVAILAGSFILAAVNGFLDAYLLRVHNGEGVFLGYLAGAVVFVVGASYPGDIQSAAGIATLSLIATGGTTFTLVYCLIRMGNRTERSICSHEQGHLSPTRDQGELPSDLQ